MAKGDDFPLCPVCATQMDHAAYDDGVRHWKEAWVCPTCGYHDWWRPKENSVATDFVATVNEQVKNTLETRHEELEKLTAAYYSQTQCLPSEVELVEMRLPTETRWYFRKRVETTQGESICL